MNKGFFKRLMISAVFLKVSVLPLYSIKKQAKEIGYENQERSVLFLKDKRMKADRLKAVSTTLTLKN